MFPFSFSFLLQKGLKEKQVTERKNFLFKKKH